MNRFLITSVLLSTLLALIGCQPEVVEKPALRPVRAVQVHYGGSELARTFSGTAQTNRIIDLSFRTGGIISVFNPSVGQQVKKGDLLAQINNVEARLAQEQAVSSLNSASSQMNTAELSLERVRRLYESGTASLSEYETAKNNFRTAEASYKSAQRSVEIQEAQVEYGEIYSPEDGRISAVFKDVDENVAAGEVVAVLNAGEDMEIEVGLPESIINSVDEGVEASISLPALPGESYRGRVTEISPALDERTATYPVTVTITNPSQKIRSGMAANVTFNLNGGAEVQQNLTVPPQSVGEDINGRYVFVLEKAEDETAIASKRQVEVGALTPQGFRILAGLEPGEWIATAGVNTLIDGQKVLHRE